MTLSTDDYNDGDGNENDYFNKDDRFYDKTLMMTEFIDDDKNSDDDDEMTKLMMFMIKIQ